MTAHIAVDMDDVLLDFMGGLQHAIKTEYGVIVPDFTKWDVNELLDPILGKSWWKWMRERDWLWSNFPAIDGAIGGLTQLREDGNFIEIVTSKPEWAEYTVWKWMGKWRPPVNRVTIVEMDQHKVDMTDADLLLDDKPQNVDEFAEEGRIGVLFGRSHNRDSVVHPDVIRVDGWRNAVELIRQEVAAL